MLGLPDGEKNFKDGQTDGQTDRRTDILPRHSPRYAYASRGKNVYYINVLVFVFNM